MQAFRSTNFFSKPNKEEAKRFAKDKAVLQMQSFQLIHIAGIIVAFFTFIAEYIYYKPIISPQSLNNYTIAFIFYEIFLVALLVLFTRQIKYYQATQKVRLQLINSLVYASVYGSTSLVFVVTFLGTMYGGELIMLGAPLCIFMVVIMLNNIERLIYFVYTLVLFIILGSFTISSEPSFPSTILKAGMVNVLFYISGLITFNWYLVMKRQTYSLENNVNTQRKTLQFLIDELQTKDYEIDSTDPKSVNQAILRLLGELSESKKTISEALRKAEEASEAKEAFLASMSHEIRTPLNTITGMTRELLKQDDLSDTHKSYIKRTEQASLFLNSIVNNILDLSKIEANEINIDPDDFSLTSLVANALSLLSSKANEKSIEITYNLNENLKKAYIGDEVRIKQILINILSNAIKFTNEGKVNVDVREVKNEEDIYWVEIKVEDTGIGMDDSFIEFIFKKYSQENRNSPTNSNGAGLGMTITKELVERMGGEIEVKSTKNQGSTVTVRLPLKLGQVERIFQDVNINTEGSLANKTILLVEDNPMNRIIVENSLKDTQCILLSVENGKEAIELLNKTDVDLVLMDIQMPIMNGMEATKYIRNQLKLDVPIIALTANAFKKDIDLYLDIGMNDYITKPYQESVLFQRLFHALDMDVPIFSKEETSEIEKSDTIDENQLFSTYQLEQIDNNPAFIAEMLSLIVENLTDAITQMEQFEGTEKERESIRNLVHKMKPGLQTLSVVDMQDEIDQINDYRTGDEIKSFDFIVDKLLPSLQALKIQIVNKQRQILNRNN